MTDIQPCLLVAYDFSEPSGLALTRGLELAHATGSTPHVVHVADHSGDDRVVMSAGGETRTFEWAQAQGVLQRRVQEYLNALVSRHACTFDRAYSHLHVGDAANEIVKLARSLGATLVVTGTQGRVGVSRALLGSVAEKVVRSAPCPVLVVRETESDAAPEVDGPCSDCQQMRVESSGERLWCARHEQSLGRRHTYHHVPRNVSAQPNLPLVVPMSPTPW